MTLAMRRIQQSEGAYQYKNPDYGPYPLRTSDSDVSRLAKNDANNIHPEIEERDGAVTEGVPTANSKKILGDSESVVDTASNWTDKLATNTDLTATQWKEPKTTDDSIRGVDATGRNPETKEDRTAPYKKDATQNIHTTVHMKQRVDTLLSLMIHPLQNVSMKNIGVARLERLMLTVM